MKSTIEFRYAGQIVLLQISAVSSRGVILSRLSRLIQQWQEIIHLIFSRTKAIRANIRRYQLSRRVRAVLRQREERLERARKIERKARDTRVVNKLSETLRDAPFHSRTLRAP